MKATIKNLLKGTLLFSALLLPARQSNAAVIYATDTTISAIADPGGIITGTGTSPNITTTPSWFERYDTVLQRNVIGVAEDSAYISDPTINAQAIVQFEIGGIDDGDYNLSLLVRTVNIKSGTTSGATPRNQSFAVRLTALGTASINGNMGGSTDWLIVTPIMDDYAGGGHRAPWLDLNLTGGNNTAFSVTGAWNTVPSVMLAGGAETGGSFRIDVLDGVRSNYSYLLVDSFNFVVVPEPSTALLLFGCGFGLLFIARRKK